MYAARTRIYAKLVSKGPPNLWQGPQAAPGAPHLATPALFIINTKPPNKEASPCTYAQYHVRAADFAKCDARLIIPAMWSLYCGARPIFGTKLSSPVKSYLNTPAAAVAVSVHRWTAFWHGSAPSSVTLLAAPRVSRK